MSATKNYSFYNVVGAGTVMIGATYGLARYSYGLFLPYIQDSFGLDISWLGFLASSSYVGYLVATVIGSVLSGKAGPKIPLLLGGISAVIGMFMVSVAFNNWILLFGFTIAGMSPGFAYPPLSDIVVVTIKESKRDFAFAVINAGTSVGVLIATPIAVMAGGHWRMAWALFAILTILVTIWNYFMAPSEGIKELNNDLPSIKLDWLIHKASIRLFAWAFLFGIVSSAIWTFGVDYIILGKLNFSFFGCSISANSFSKIFWAGVGISGFIGVVGGGFVNKFGIRLMAQSATLGLAIGSLLLVIFDTNGYIIFIASLLFGSAFMLGTAYLGIWAINIFYDRPSAGMGTAFLMLSVGQLCGPIIFGQIASGYSLEFVFYIAGVLGIFSSFMKPSENIFGMTPIKSGDK